MVSAVGHDHRAAVEEVGTAFSETEAASRWSWAAVGQQPSLFRGCFMGAAHRSPMAGSARAVSQRIHLLASFAAMGGAGCVGRSVARSAVGSRPTRPFAVGRDLFGRKFCSCKKGGLAVGKTKRGKGTKWMLLVDGQGIPLGVLLASASPHEAPLAEATLAQVKVPRPRGRPRQRPRRIIADKAYDSDPLRRRLKRRGIELIVPYRWYKKNKPFADRRKLRRCRRRWKIERTNAWLGFFRRLATRYDRILTIYRGFFHIACLIITLRHL